MQEITPINVTISGYLFNEYKEPITCVMVSPIDPMYKYLFSDEDLFRTYCRTERTDIDYYTSDTIERLQLRQDFNEWVNNQVEAGFIQRLS